MLQPTIQKNDALAYVLIGILSVIVFAAVVMLKKVHLQVEVGFDVHVFAAINAVINSMVSVLLIAALVFVKQKKYALHRKAMLTAMVLSVLFLVSYIAHHLLSGSTVYGGVGAVKYFYLFILITHIILAGIILPFILLTVYRGLTGEFNMH